MSNSMGNDDVAIKGEECVHLALAWALTRGIASRVLHLYVWILVRYTRAITP